MKNILYIVVLLLMVNCNTKDNEIYILPKNFDGHIIILFNQKNGAKEKYQKEKRVYEIPSSGILKTQFKENYGLSDFPEIYYKSIHKNNRIPYKYDFDSLSEDKVYGFGAGSGGVNKDLKGDSVVKYRELYVGTKSQIEFAMKKADSLNIIELISEN